MAACLVIIICAVTVLFTLKSTENTSNLPMLSLTADRNDGMGFEGYLAYDVSELVNANPWNESQDIATLPVYRNTLTYDENLVASGADFDKMQEFMLEVAERLGIEPDTLDITDDAPDEETKQNITDLLHAEGYTIPDGYFNPKKLIAETDKCKIEVDQTMTAAVYFEPALSLPEEYNFGDNASYADMTAIADYLKVKYKDIIGIDNPQTNIYGGDYDIYANQSYHISFYDAGGDITEQIINYNFNRVIFYCNSSNEGEKFIVRIFQPDLSDKVGDYPIISLAQAKKMLSKGKYITSVPDEIPDLKYVKKAELVYKTSELEEYYMPYYRFYVEMPNEENEYGLKTYGIYYVPAVDESYISNMPVSK
jgi:hypothetical protein